jgi:hypothetical protein
LSQTSSLISKSCLRLRFCICCHCYRCCHC